MATRPAPRPSSPSASPALPALSMMLLQRVRQFVRQHALFRRRDARRGGPVRRIGFGRARADPARARRRRATCAWSGPRISTISFGPTRAARRAVFGLGRALARRAVRRGSRRTSGRARVASVGRSRTPRGRPDTSSSSALGGSSTPTSSRSATRATTRPRRFCSGCCAAPAREAWPPCTLGTARLSGRSSTVAGTELRRYLDERHVTYVDDETNDDVTIPRNRVRAELLPLLVDRFNPADRRRAGQRSGACPRDVGLAGVCRRRASKRGRESFPSGCDCSRQRDSTPFSSWTSRG